MLQTWLNIILYFKYEYILVNAIPAYPSNSTSFLFTNHTIPIEKQMRRQRLNKLKLICLKIQQKKKAPRANHARNWMNEINHLLFCKKSNFFILFFPFYSFFLPKLPQNQNKNETILFNSTNLHNLNQYSSDPINIIIESMNLFYINFDLYFRWFVSSKALNRAKKKI